MHARDLAPNDRARVNAHYLAKATYEHMLSTIRGSDYDPKSLTAVLERYAENLVRIALAELRKGELKDDIRTKALEATLEQLQNMRRDSVRRQAGVVEVVEMD